jgi:ABC-2 type transport system permease protein
VAIAGWLIYGFAPLVSGLGWLRYLSLFYYYAGHDPLTQGIGIGDLIVLAAFTLAATAFAMFAFARRDLRA